MKSFADYLARKRKEYGTKFDASNLSKEFVPFYENGKRIRVRFSYGEELTGTIGITSGWRPAFLLMRTKRSISSPYTLSHKDHIVGIVK